MIGTDNTFEKTGNGIGFGTVLFMVFLVLKLTKVIAWSWWWVTAPIWAPIAFVLLIVVLTLVIAGGNR